MYDSRKRSALWGNIMALFLSDMLLDSISDLASSSFNRTQLLSALQKQEDADYAMFQSNWESDIIEYRMVPLDSDLEGTFRSSFATLQSVTQHDFQLT